MHNLFRYVRRAALLVVAFLALLLPGLIAAPTFARAASYSCDEAGLDQALAAGGTATLGCNTAMTIMLSSAKTITTNITLDGGGFLTLSGGGTMRIFRIATNTHLTLQNMTLRDGSVTGTTSDTGAGGAIYNDGGTLTVSGVTFNNNSAVGGSGGTSGSADGGAVYSIGGNLTVQNSTFTDNTATSPIKGDANTGAHGGAISTLNTSVAIIATTFYRNVISNTGTTDAASDDRGAAVTCQGGTAYINGSTFTENGGNVSGISDGGAVALRDITTPVVLEHNTFARNTARGGYGGAVYALNAQLNISSSNFTDNSVVAPHSFIGNGGAIYINTARQQLHINLTIDDSTFTGNSAVSSGAVDLAGDGNSITVRNSTFAANTAYNGGVEMLHGGNTAFFENSTFVNNNTNLNDGGGGGALIITGMAKIHNSTFIGNNAHFGGAIEIYGGTLNLANSTLSGNNAQSGTALFNASGTLTVSNVLVGGNTQVSNCISDTRYSGAFIDAGHNISSDNSCGFSNSSSFSNTDPKLDPNGLADNGGTTQTIALLAGSSAIDSGDSAACPATDQRGYTRNGACDIGAFEYAGAAAPVLFDAAFTPASIESGDSSSLIFHLSNPGATSLTGVTFSDTLPAQITPLSAFSSCATSGNLRVQGNIISVSGGSLTSNESCTIVVPVVGTAVGQWQTQSSALTTDQAGIGAAAVNATLAVTPQVVVYLELQSQIKYIRRCDIQMYTITARNVRGTIVPTYAGTLHFASTDPRATLPANYTMTPTDKGIHTFSVGYNSLGGFWGTTVSDIAQPNIYAATGGVYITSGCTPTTMKVESLPSLASVGTPTQFNVRILDEAEVLVTDYRGTVHFTSSDPNATLPADYTFTASDKGTHTFPVTFRSNGNCTVTASDSTVSGTTTFTVAPASGTHLVFSTQPDGAAVNHALTPQPLIRVEDANNQLVTDYSGSVSVAITSGTGASGAALGGTTTVQVVNGLATFTDLSINKSGTSYSLTATSGALTSATSTTFTITPPPATHLVFSTQPSLTRAGQLFVPTVTIAVLDADNNPVTGYTGNITLSIKPGTGTSGAALGGTTTIAVINSVATFTGLSVDKAGFSYVLAAKAGDLGTESTAFDVLPAGQYVQIQLRSAQDTTIAAGGTYEATLFVRNLSGAALPAGTPITFSLKGLKFKAGDVGVSSNVALKKVGAGSVTIVLKDALADTATLTIPLHIGANQNSLPRKGVKTVITCATLAVKVGAKTVTYGSNSLHAGIGATNGGTGTTGATQALTIKAPRDNKATPKTRLVFTGTFFAPGEPVTITLLPQASFGKLPAQADKRGAITITSLTGLGAATYSVTITGLWSGVVGTGTIMLQ